MKWKELMKNQTDRKIKVLRYENVEEYKNSFLQFGQKIVLLPTSQMGKIV